MRNLFALLEQIFALSLSVPSLFGNQLQTQRRAHQDFWCQVWVSPQEVILYKYAIPRSLRSLSTRDYPIQIHTKYYLQTETWPALHLHIGYYHWNHGIYIYDITNETTASTYRLLPLEQQHLHIGYYDGSHRKEKNEENHHHRPTRKLSFELCLFVSAVLFQAKTNEMEMGMSHGRGLTWQD